MKNLLKIFVFGAILVGSLSFVSNAFAGGIVISNPKWDLVIESGNPTPLPPDRTYIWEGESVKLSWIATGQDECSILQPSNLPDIPFGPGPYTYLISPRASTTYEIRCTSSNTSVPSASVTIPITVNHRLPDLTIKDDTNTVDNTYNNNQPKNVQFKPIVSNPIGGSTKVSFYNSYKVESITEKIRGVYDQNGKLVYLQRPDDMAIDADPSFKILNYSPKSDISSTTKEAASSTLPANTSITVNNFDPYTFKENGNKLGEDYSFYRLTFCADSKDEILEGNSSNNYGNSNNCTTSCWFSSNQVGSINWGQCNTATPDRPNLQAEKPTPTNAIAETPITLSAKINNVGGGSTGKSFTNLFQLAKTEAEKNEQYNIPVIPSPVSMNTLDGGKSETLSLSYTFPTSGTYYIRACADQITGDTAKDVYINGVRNIEYKKDYGVINNETDEQDNCSDWTTMVVSKLPDLIASDPFDKELRDLGSLLPPRNFTSTIKNQGAISTGAPFSNLFQTLEVKSKLEIAELGLDNYDKIDPSGWYGKVGNFVDPVKMPALLSGASDDTSIMTADTLFPRGWDGGYYYYVRACADRSNIAINNNVIYEGLPTSIGETNNCSKWVLTPFGAGKIDTGGGILTATSCEIPLNSNSCGSTLGWEVKNPIPSALTGVTTPPSIIPLPDTDKVSGTTTYVMSYTGVTPRYFFLYHNGDKLAEATATATCSQIPTPTTWNGTSCVQTGTEPSGILTGTGCMITIIGGKSCDTTLTSEIFKPIAGKASNITKNKPNSDTIVVANLNTARTETTVTLSPKDGDIDFYLNHNTNSLATITIKATCGMTSSGDALKWKGDTLGCQKTMVPPATISVNLSAIPDSGNSPMVSTLKWVISGATPTSCNALSTLNGVDSSVWTGPKLVSSSSDPVSLVEGKYIFTITCHKDGISPDAVANADVTVGANLNNFDFTFTANPTKIYKGKSSTLKWTTNPNAKCMSIGSTPFDLNGNVSNGTTEVHPIQTTTYQIRCTKGSGLQAVTHDGTATVTVTSIGVIER